MHVSIAALSVLSASLFAQGVVGAGQVPSASTNVEGDVTRKLPRRTLAELNLDFDEPKIMTNAKRLAQGMTPSRPRKLFSPTEELAPRASPSSTPPNGVTYPLCGYVYAAYTNNTELGWLKTSMDGAGVLGMYAKYDDQDIMSVCVESPDPTSGYSDILINNGVYESLPYLGAIEGPSSKSENLDGGNGDYAVLGYVKPTSAHTGPTTDPDENSNSYNCNQNAMQQYESNVWTVDPDTLALTTYWTRTTLDTERLYTGESYEIPYNGFDHYLVAAPDPENYRTINSVDYNALTLTLIQNRPPSPP